MHLRLIKPRPLLLTLALPLAARAQEGAAVRAAAVPSGWVASAPPAYATAAWLCAQRARGAWRVQLAADSQALRIERAPGSGETPEHEIAVAGGRLTGSDHGEWGGEIRWVPDHGRGVRLAATNLHAFLVRPSGVYGFTGQDGIVGRGGQVVRLRGSPARGWRMERVLRLDATPDVVSALPADSVLVLAAGGTSDVLLVLDLAPPARVVARAPVPWSTYPTSIVRDRAGIVYVGIRTGVARLRPGPRGYTADWLVPATCRTLQPVDSLVFEPCQCARSAL